MENKSRVFIIPHFGKFNNYFQLFLNSCKQNVQTNFLILTDDYTQYDYPANVEVIYTSLSEVSQRATRLLGKDVQIERPYKLCDFRAIYGLLFKDLISKYAYWGYCDTDLILGNFDNMIAPIIEKNYDKIFFLGHCSLVKNSEEIAHLLLSDKEFVKKLLDVEHNYSLDEEFNGSINNILLKHKKNVYFKELEANTYTKTSNFYLTTWNFELNQYDIHKTTNHIFVREPDGLFEYYIENNQLLKKEYLYIHFQSRPMKVKIAPHSTYYKIIPNAFEELEYPQIDYENFSQIKKKNMNLHYFRLRSKNLFIKLTRKMKRK